MEREYRIQAPDGTILRIVGPEDATPEQLRAAAERAYAARQPAPPAPTAERVVAETQQARDVERAQILQQELSRAEQKAQTGDERAAADVAALQSEISRLPQKVRQAVQTPEAGAGRGSIIPPLAGQPQPTFSTAQQPSTQPAPQIGVPRAIGVREPRVAPAPEPSLRERLVGELEAAGALATGATTGVLGAIQSGGQALAQSILSGTFGTPEAARMIEQAVTRGMQGMTYQPRTPAGQEAMQTIGGALEVLPPVLPIVGPAVVPAAQVGGQARAAVSAAVQPPAQISRVEPGLVVPTPAPPPGRVVPTPAPPAPGRVMPTPAPAAPVSAAAPTPTMVAGQPPIMPAGMAVQRGAAGAAGTPVAVERRAVAATMPVPFVGPTALTKGQATRDFAQLQFEKETAKLPDVGAPLRERVQQQTANFIQNFDALIDLPGPIARETREVGRIVSDALVNRAEVRRREIRRAYEAARAQGEMSQPVEMAPLAQGLTTMSSMEGLVPMISAVRREATRLGAIAQDEAGNIVPREMSVNDAETLRQFVNNATDWTDRREATFGRQINSLIDQATENSGGDMYRRARQLRAQFADEFENVGLTAKLIGTKRGTNERQIAVEDIFDKVIILSPVDEMNKTRTTLLRAGPEGRQAWADLKSQGIDYIKQRALSASERDAAGNPLLSPAQFQRTVQGLDRDGKLEALYGRRQAQTLRDLAELSSVIYTAPPGAINTSNTASALQVALDSLVTFGATGVPAPVLTTLREANKYLKNRATKKRVQEALSQE